MPGVPLKLQYKRSVAAAALEEGPLLDMLASTALAVGPASPPAIAGPASTQLPVAAAAEPSAPRSKAQGKKKSKGKPRPSSVGIVKPRRPHYGSTDRPDNCIAKLLKAMGYVRRKNSSEMSRRRVTATYQMLLTYFQHLQIADWDSELAAELKVVWRMVAYRLSQPTMARCWYTPEFKAALKVLVSEDGLSFIRDACPSAPVA